jgi:uncharacterized protein YndB with AHSA1/START domain
MRAYDASSTIEASPDAIWAILTDAPGYTTWDSGIVRVEGRIAPGETIKVVSKVNPGRTFPVKVTEFTPGQRMTWSGGMPLGLFKGVRTFTLSPQGDGEADRAGGVQRPAAADDLALDARPRALVRAVRDRAEAPRGSRRVVEEPRYRWAGAASGRSIASLM